MKTSVRVLDAFAYGEGENHPDRGDVKAVMAAAQQSAQSYPGGTHAVAKRMATLLGKMVPSTLEKKINPNCDTHHLSVQEAMALQLVTGDASMLQAMAEALGFVCMRAVPASSTNPMELHWQKAAAAADYDHAVADAMLRPGGGVVTTNAMRRCDVMGSELVSAINAELGGLRALIPAAPGDKKP